MFQAKQWIRGNEFAVVDRYALIFCGWGVRGGFPMKELSPYTALAGPHDEAADGAENCRRRAERFNLIASLRLGSSLIRLILKRFERSEAIERLEPFGLVPVQRLMLGSNPRVGEIKLER